MIPPKVFNIFHSVKRYYLTLTRLVISCKSFRKLSIVLVISWEMSTLWLAERWRDRDTCGTALSVTWPFGMFSIGSVALLGTSVVSWYSSWSLWSDSSLLGETERDDERLEMNRIGEFSLEALNDSLVRLEMSLSSRVYLEESLVGTWLVPKRLRQPIPNRRNWSRPVRWWGLQGNSPPCQNSSWSPLSFWVKLSQHFAIRGWRLSLTNATRPRIFSWPRCATCHPDVSKHRIWRAPPGPRRPVLSLNRCPGLLAWNTRRNGA